jgi:hypothetical protein
LSKELSSSEPPLKVKPSDILKEFVRQSCDRNATVELFRRWLQASGFGQPGQSPEATASS